jgi:hypothetical protein
VHALAGHQPFAALRQTLLDCQSSPRPGSCTWRGLTRHFAPSLVCASGFWFARCRGCLSSRLASSEWR